MINSSTPEDDNSTAREERTVHQTVGQALRMIGDELNFNYNHLAVKNVRCLVITNQRVKRQVFQDGKP